ncbi:hypothetical protein AVEN_77735-1 [Araneus ventricosus]|uniref:Uncharacterized protein n=1 Tax=Araneus ventricosus TaxID=182803 RepID=A0A4Y2SFL3_ARAVE|nr:hypothetical protein AVEN_77735-1 [Araneus ventricosus]
MTFRAKIFSKTKKINSNKVVKGRDPSVTGSGANSSQNGNSVAGGASIRLPKLSLQKFADDPSKWLEFFNSYDNAIHSNSGLSKIEKFTYLKSLLSGFAYNCVSGYSLSEENYDIFIKSLEERFGRQDVIISKFM